MIVKIDFGVHHIADELGERIELKEALRNENKRIIAII